MSEPSGFAPRSLIAALADADVEFCVVGAFALGRLIDRADLDRLDEAGQDSGS